MIKDDALLEISKYFAKKSNRNLIEKKTGRDDGNFIWIGYSDGLLANPDCFCHYEIYLPNEKDDFHITGKAYVEVHFEKHGNKDKYDSFIEALKNKYNGLEVIKWTYAAIRFEGKCFELTENEKIIDNLFDLERLIGQDLRAFEFENTIDISNIEKLKEQYKKIFNNQAKTVFESVEIKRPLRNVVLPEIVKSYANGKCQLCNQSSGFKDVHGRDYLEAHHIKWLSKGGRDDITNMVALCPNCHKKMHIVGDKKDINKLKKIAKNQKI